MQRYASLSSQSPSFFLTQALLELASKNQSLFSLFDASSISELLSTSSPSFLEEGDEQFKLVQNLGVLSALRNSQISFLSHQGDFISKVALDLFYKVQSQVRILNKITTQPYSYKLKNLSYELSSFDFSSFNPESQVNLTLNGQVTLPIKTKESHAIRSCQFSFLKDSQEDLFQIGTFGFLLSPRPSLSGGSITISLEKESLLNHVYLPLSVPLPASLRSIEFLDKKGSSVLVLSRANLYPYIQKNPNSLDFFLESPISAREIILSFDPFDYPENSYEKISLTQDELATLSKLHSVLSYHEQDLSFLENLVSELLFEKGPSSFIYYLLPIGFFGSFNLCSFESQGFLRTNPYSLEGREILSFYISHSLIHSSLDSNIQKFLIAEKRNSSKEAVVSKKRFYSPKSASETFLINIDPESFLDKALFPTPLNSVQIYKNVEGVQSLIGYTILRDPPDLFNIGFVLNSPINNETIFCVGEVLTNDFYNHTYFIPSLSGWYDKSFFFHLFEDQRDFDFYEIEIEMAREFGDSYRTPILDSLSLTLVSREV